MNQDLELHIEALRVLRDADKVSRRLHAAIEAGNPSFHSDVHLLKSRVKSTESLMGKVKNRRENGKYNYSIKDVNDIIGLRIITKSKDQIPRVIDGLFDIILGHQSAGFSLFIGLTPSECIKECIIFHKAKEDNYAIEVIKGALDRGINSINDNVSKRDAGDAGSYNLDESSNEGEETTKIVKVETRESGYSSVHIVLNCISERDSRGIIPVEIQIRSIYEDIWGEIDHSTKYKGKSLSKSSTEKVGEYLRDLGDLLDKCSEIASDIRLIYETEYSGYGVRSSVQFEYPDSKAVLRIYDIIDNELLNEEYKNIISNLSRSLKEELKNSVINYDNLYAANMNINSHYSNLLSATASTTEKLQSVLQTLDENHAIKIDISNSNDLNDVISFAHYQVGVGYYCMYSIIKMEIEGKVKINNLAKSRFDKLITGNVTKDLHIINDILLNNAELHYKKSCLNPVYEKSAMTKYRLAEICLERSSDIQFQYAEQQLAEAIIISINDPIIPRNHISILQIANKLSIVKWTRGYNIKHEIESGRVGGGMRAIERLQYKQAIESIIRYAPHDYLVPDENPLTVCINNRSYYERLIGHNLLDYYCCYLAAGGCRQELYEINVTDKLIEWCFSKTTGSDNPTFQDTLRAYYLIIGDQVKAVEAARAVLSGLNRDSTRTRYKDLWITDMEREASNTIKKYSLDEANGQLT